jgi:FAD synthetase
MNVHFRYNLQLKIIPGPIKHALGIVLAERPELKAVLMGTRRTDPYSEALSSFQVLTLSMVTESLNWM